MSSHVIGHSSGTGMAAAGTKSAGFRLGRPWRAALLIGSVNLALSVTWIIFSGGVAANLADSVEQLERIERWKGFFWVGAMSGVLGVITWILLRRVERQQGEIDRHRAVLAENEGRALAGLIASAVAHDMNNMLAIAVGQVDMLRDDGQGGAAVGHLDRSLDQLVGLSRKLQSLGKAALPSQAESFDLARAVNEAVGLVAGHERVRGRNVTIDAPDRLAFRGSEVLVSRIVTNLVLNAAAATHPAGRIRVRLRPTPSGGVLEVHDDGPGIPRERRAEIFEPFATGTPGGTGLGLVSVRGAAQEHGGQVEVLDSDLGGACFRVVLTAM